MNKQDQNKVPFSSEAIFQISNDHEFNKIALLTFQYQYLNNSIYRQYCDLINTETNQITHYSQIPFLPISFYKNKEVKSFKGSPEIIFSSSGTTGMIQSKHLVKSTALYEQSFMAGFESRFGSISDFVVLGLLPSYLEREGSSLIYMVEKFINKSKHPESGFFLNNHDELLQVIKAAKGKKILLIGVAYALLDFGEGYNPDLSGCMVMETGGMKGQRKEMIKSELHDQLKAYFNLSTIYSEYGMTELLSQAYSVGQQFECPPWMKILTRSHSDPFELIVGKTGGINIIDLANIYSCSFIASQDLGKINKNGFEIVGRFDNSDIRGCNLLVD